MAFNQGKRWLMRNKPGVVISTLGIVILFAFQNCGQLSFNQSKEFRSEDPAPAVGTLDLGTGFNAPPSGFKITNNAVFAIGNFTIFNGFVANGIVKMDRAGNVDQEFVKNIGSGTTAQIQILQIASDGDLIIGTTLPAGFVFNGRGPSKMFKLNPDGTFHQPWNLPLQIDRNPTEDQLLSIATLSGYIAMSTWTCVKVVDLDGNEVYYGTGAVNIHAIAAVPNSNKLFVASRVNTALNGRTTPNFRLLDFTAGAGAMAFGQYDPVFTANGGAGANSTTGNAIVDPKGQYAVVAATTVFAPASANYSWNGGDPAKHMGLYKIRIDGIEDPNWKASFGLDSSGASPTPCAIDSQDRIYVIAIPGVLTVDGTILNRNTLVRLTPQGRLDKMFGLFDGPISACNLIKDDEIVVTGQFTSYNGNPVNSMIELHADGTKY